MFMHKIHEADGKKILACCDASIKGMKVSEDPDIRAGEFYGDEEIGEEVAELWKTCDSANLLGNKIVELFISRGIIKRENTIKIGGVLHAIIIKI